ncbi:MAG: hypothetical protein N2249_03675 [Melioribacter sp.]|nr:hypothetical protein [Melioribacter sp.]
MNMDELLNEYIDDSLSKEQNNELTNKLKEDELLYRKFKALYMVDEILKNIEIYKAPDNTVDKVMKLILLKTQKPKQSINKFAASVFTILVLILVSASTVMIYMLNKEDSYAFSDYLAKTISSSINLVTNLMLDEVSLMIASTIILIAFITFYLLLEIHNNFKNKLKNSS